MKKIPIIFALVFALAIPSILSTGMGYPQDMFAEHLSTKRVKAHASPKKASQERTGFQKATCSPAIQRAARKDTTPCSSKTLPNKSKETHQATS